MMNEWFHTGRHEDRYLPKLPTSSQKSAVTTTTKNNKTKKKKSNNFYSLSSSFAKINRPTTNWHSHSVLSILNTKQNDYAHFAL